MEFDSNLYLDGTTKITVWDVFFLKDDYAGEERCALELLCYNQLPSSQCSVVESDLQLTFTSKVAQSNVCLYTKIYSTERKVILVLNTCASKLWVNNKCILHTEKTIHTAIIVDVDIGENEIVISHNTPTDSFFGGISRYIYLFAL